MSKIGILSLVLFFVVTTKAEPFEPMYVDKYDLEWGPGFPNMATI